NFGVAGVSIVKSHSIEVHASECIGSPALVIEVASVSVVSSLLRGDHASSYYFSTIPAHAAVVARDARVDMRSVTLLGGDGYYLSHPFGVVNTPPMPTITATNSVIWVGGMATTAHSGLGAAENVAAPAVRVEGGSVTIDPATSLRGFKNSLPVIGSGVVHWATLPTLKIEGGVLGQNVTVTHGVRAGPTRALVSYVGIAGPPLPTWIGDWGLTTMALPWYLGTTDRPVATFALPLDSSLSGISISAQAWIDTGPSSSGPRLTNIASLRLQ
ncbi:MAG TPA: hypothetical protein PKE00_05045, partial [Planctomycetota bacterium]|nr:hypothetical protein [Planctomycetota bacterium]